jgi:hypothetical protein
MRHKRETQNDSLDLLLDTICNLFGLIILITILIAVLAQVSGQEALKELESNIAQKKDTSKELVSLNSEKEFLNNELQITKTSALLKSIAIASEAERKLISAKKELERRRTMLSEENKLISDETVLIQKLRDQIPLLKEEIEILESELKRAKSMKDIKLRTPKKREVEGLMPVQVILKNNKAYITNNTTGWKNYPNPKAERCRIWKEFNPSAVDLIRSTAIDLKPCYGVGGQDIERTIYLLPSGGIPIPTDTYIDRNRDWVDFLDSLDPQEHVISLKVHPDSFEAFSEIRRSVTKANFNYDVDPKFITQPYRDRIKDDHHATAQ